MLLAQGNNFRLKGDLLGGYIHGLEQALQALMLGGRTIKDEAIRAFIHAKRTTKKSLDGLRELTCLSIA